MADCPPELTIDLWKTTAPNQLQLQYNLCRNTDIPSILCQNRKCTYTEGRWTPPPWIDHRSLQQHYTLSLWHNDECTSTNGRWTPQSWTIALCITTTQNQFQENVYWNKACMWNMDMWTCPAQMVSLSLSLSLKKSSCLLWVPLCQNNHIDSVRICINWSEEKIVHITFLNIVCKNMSWGGIYTNVKTVMKYSSKYI